MAEQKPTDEQSPETEWLAEIGAKLPVFAHAVANPLSGLSTSIQLLRKHLARQNDRFATALLEDITSEVQRMTSLLDEFRSLSRPIRLNRQRTDVVKIIKGTLPAALRDEAPIEVVEEFDAELPAIAADAEKIEQVFHLLCKNAVAAMPHGGRLTIRGKKSADHLIFELEDTGAEKKPNGDIFEPFTRAAESGLGLAMARRIIRVHGGAITYHAESDKGRKFHLAFPLR